MSLSNPLSRHDGSLEVSPTKGCVEGLSPFAGSLRVPLKHNSVPSLARMRVDEDDRTGIPGLMGATAPLFEPGGITLER